MWKRSKSSGPSDASDDALTVMARAVYINCDLGFVVGLVTHRIERLGSLVWWSERVFDSEPDLNDAIAVDKWRWAVWFPVGSAVRRKILTSIGNMPVPEGLRDIPTMRSNLGANGWVAVEFVDGTSRTLGHTTDKSLPPYMIVNDTRLKEMLVSGWVPENKW